MREKVYRVRHNDTRCDTACCVILQKKKKTFESAITTAITIEWETLFFEISINSSE